MFGSPKTALLERIRRVAQLARAFALLEDAGDRQPSTGPETGLQPNPEPAVAHPHSARLVREPRRRRPGTTAPRAALCLTPVRPQPVGPMRRELAAPRRLHSHRAGPHHA